MYRQRSLVWLAPLFVIIFTLLAATTLVAQRTQANDAPNDPGCIHRTSSRSGSASQWWLRASLVLGLYST